MGCCSWARGYKWLLIQQLFGESLACPPGNTAHTARVQLKSNLGAVQGVFCGLNEQHWWGGVQWFTVRRVMMITATIIEMGPRGCSSSFAHIYSSISHFISVMQVLLLSLQYFRGGKQSKERLSRLSIIIGLPSSRARMDFSPTG